MKWQHGCDWLSAALAREPAFFSPVDTIRASSQVDTSKPLLNIAFLAQLWVWCMETMLSSVESLPIVLTSLITTSQSILLIRSRLPNYHLEKGGQGWHLRLQDIRCSAETDNLIQRGASLSFFIFAFAATRTPKTGWLM